ncbi:DUF443 domain-containing protein [Salipaludibacillus sp. LMS25]|nr:DUF443 domain-containing protein [Salipaludibacillus sp. LMS25]
MTIDGEHYLMDTGRPFWKGLFPYSFWLFPHPGYKLDDDKVLNEVQEIQDDLGKTLGIGAAGGGGAFFLTPLMEYFNLSTSSQINGLILFLALTVILFSRFYYSKQSEEKINKIVNLTQLETKKLIIRPSISYFLKFTLLYISFIGLSILSVGIFIEYGNMIALLCSMVLFFFLLIFNIINLRPDETYGKLANTK